METARVRIGGHEMAGRRSHQRFAVANPWEGAMRVLRDVVVDRTSRDEVMAVCQAPGVTGETMTLDLMGGGVTLGFRVTVLESRPVIVGGAVRHRLRLGLIPPVADARSAGVPAGHSDSLSAEAL
jgi:hypothetical protein